MTFNVAILSSMDALIIRIPPSSLGNIYILRGWAPYPVLGYKSQVIYAILDTRIPMGRNIRIDEVKKKQGQCSKRVNSITSANVDL